MVNTIRENETYSYRKVLNKKKNRKVASWACLMVVVLVVMAFVTPYILADKNANGEITLVSLVTATGLLVSIWRNIHHAE